MAERVYTGILFIGDPHVASRVPGFRRDDYPETILGKLKWALDFADRELLLPVLLGDLFHYPRDNSNALLTRLIQLFAGREVLAVMGNHDCTENGLTEDDSLSVMRAAGRLRLLEDNPWRGIIGRRPVSIGGSAWGTALPRKHDKQPGELTVWITHHDIRFAGYEESGRMDPREIPGIDIVVNGHIHRHLDDIVRGSTHWLNPGNISRIKRSDKSREHVPAALRIDISAQTWTANRVPIPHAPFDDVFHPEIAEASVVEQGSAFVRGLEELETLRTESGASLMAFLETNLSQFDPRVAQEIRLLAQEICENE